ncbi:hypothetical protein Fmac_003818 [Flemingia macrophylla]|uniref:Uncharacterized protein n=1 Tax=Flemingia macrophylla TaxID=520843 RepID=A0ABD1N3D4_9FABA
MASSKVLCRLSCRIQTLVHSKCTKPSLSLHPNPLSLSARRLYRCGPHRSHSKRIAFLHQSSVLENLSVIFCLFDYDVVIWLLRLPVELGSLESMMPLYSAVASARLVSSLSIESPGWGLVPQGISMPL